MGKLWRHSVGCAIGANWLAKQTGFQNLAHEAFIAGLLHDVGKLLILKVIDDLRASGHIANPPSDKLLDEVPEEYCQIARDHHIEDFDCSNVLIVLVRLADHMCHKIGIGLWKDPSLVLMATPEAKQLQLSEMDLARLEVRLEDSQVFAG